MIFVTSIFLTREEVYLHPAAVRNTCTAPPRDSRKVSNLKAHVCADKRLYYGIFQRPFACGRASGNTLRGILIEITIRRSRHTRGVCVYVMLFASWGETRARERESFSRDCLRFYFRRKALASAVYYARCVASTRRSKFYVYSGSVGFHKRRRRREIARVARAGDQSGARVQSVETRRRPSFPRRYRSASFRSPSASFDKRQNATPRFVVDRGVRRRS